MRGRWLQSGGCKAAGASMLCKAAAAPYMPPLDRVRRCKAGGARLPRRGAGVVERGGLENRCAFWVPWVRIPPSPPRTLSF